MCWFVTRLFNLSAENDFWTGLEVFNASRTWSCMQQSCWLIQRGKNDDENENWLVIDSKNEVVQ